MDRYQITFQTWDKVANVYQDIFMDMELYNDTYNAFCNLIEKPSAKIFEIGCGPGNITKYLLAQRPDFKIEAIDVAWNMIKLAQANNPQATFRVMDCREIDTITEKFDGIMCGFTIPYLSEEDCTKLIKDSAELLNSGGIFYCSAIEGNYENSGFEAGSNPENKMFVYYHQEGTLKKFLTENGFEIVETFRKKYQRSDGVISTHLILIARKSAEGFTNSTRIK